MDRRILLVAVLLVSVVAVSPVAGQQGEPKEPVDTRTINDSSLTLSELEPTGRIQADAPDSMRFMGQYGSATVREHPIGFGTPEWEYVTPSTEVHGDAVTLRTVRLGDPNERLNVHVVGWNHGEKTVRGPNGTTTTEPVARNVTEQVVEVRLGRGYDNASVPLPVSFDDTQQITMWVEEYPDTRWRFQHRTVATSRPISINSWGDFLETLIWEIGIYAFPAMLVGASFAKRHKSRALVGPQWGYGKWALAFAVPVGIAGSWLAFESAVIATRVPAALGLLFGPIAYALVLEGSDHDLDTFLFRRQDLVHATSPRGEDTHDSRFVDHVVKNGVHRAADEELVLVEPGLVPYLSRLWGNLATLDISEIETHKKGKHSPYTLEIELDPKYDLRDALIHNPPSLDRLPLTVKADIPWFGETEIPNPGVVMPVGGGTLIGWYVVDWWLGIPWIGAAAGAFVGLPFVYRVFDGGAESEPAPYHFTQAEASLAFEAGEYSDAKSLEEYRHTAWKERMKTPLEAMKASEEFDETVVRRLNEQMLGNEWTQDVRSAGDPKGAADGD